VDAFITNPAWVRTTLHPLIVNSSDQRPTWLLLYSDWLFTRQAEPFRSRLRDVVVGKPLISLLH
jgi:hypothetical protein